MSASTSTIRPSRPTRATDQAHADAISAHRLDMGQRRLLPRQHDHTDGVQPDPLAVTRCCRSQSAASCGAYASWRSGGLERRRVQAGPALDLAETSVPPQSATSAAAIRSPRARAAGCDRAPPCPDAAAPARQSWPNRPTCCLDPVLGIPHLRTGGCVRRPPIVRRQQNMWKLLGRRRRLSTDRPQRVSRPPPLTTPPPTTLDACPGVSGGSVDRPGTAARRPRGSEG